MEAKAAAAETKDVTDVKNSDVKSTETKSQSD
jgi:hypothetical protein